MICCVVVDMVKVNNFIGMTLVALSRVLHICNLLLNQFTLERLQTVKKSSGLNDLQRYMESFIKYILTFNILDPLFDYSYCYYYMDDNG